MREHHVRTQQGLNGMRRIHRGLSHGHWSCVLVACALVGCAASPPPSPTKPTPLPGGLPKSCLLPDCAIPGRFDDPDSAALAALEYLVGNYPDARQFEYAGCIFQLEGKYLATLPVTLQLSGRCLPPAVPRGSVLVADYHNHPTREEVSLIDKKSRPEIPHYVRTPSGAVLKYTPQDGRIVKLK